MSDWLSSLIAITGVLTSALLAYLAYLLNRQSQKAAIHRSLGTIYEQLMRFRTEHPEVMGMSGKWTEARFRTLYKEGKTSHRWVVYYTYVELVLDFANTVLYGRKSHALERRAYESHYKPLVKLLLTEHYPFIRTAMRGAYLSSLVRAFIHEEAQRGWDWEEKRRILVGDGD